jgi:hypothetical protein
MTDWWTKIPTMRWDFIQTWRELAPSVEIAEERQSYLYQGAHNLINYHEVYSIIIVQFGRLVNTYALTWKIVGKMSFGITACSALILGPEQWTFCVGWWRTGIQYWPKVTHAKKRTSQAECNACDARFRCVLHVAGREPVQTGNPVPVSAGSPGGGTTVRQPSFLVQRPADPGSWGVCPDLWSCARGNIQETGKLLRMDERRWRTGLSASSILLLLLLLLLLHRICYSNFARVSSIHVLQMSRTSSEVRGIMRYFWSVL